MKREQLYILGDGDAAAYYKSEADSVMCEKDARIKELEAEVKKWKNDSANCCALLHLVRKGKNPTSTEMIAEADRLEKLESENERLKSIVCDEEYKHGLSGLAQRNAELREENERLKAQVPKWHYLTKPLYIDENGNDVWDLPNEDEADTNGDVYTIHKCGARGVEQWDEIDPEVIAMWCELPTAPPTTEESSATEKENG